MDIKTPKTRPVGENYLGPITYSLEIPFLELVQKPDGNPSVWLLNHAAKTMPEARKVLLNQCCDFLSHRFTVEMASPSGEVDIVKYDAHLWLRLLQEKPRGIFIMGFCGDWGKRPKALRKLLSTQVHQCFEMNVLVMDILKRRKALTDETALLENRMEWQQAMEDFRKKSMLLTYKRIKGGFYRRKPEPVALTAFLEKLLRVAGTLWGPDEFSYILPEKELVTALDVNCLVMAMSQVLFNALGAISSVRETAVTVRYLKSMVQIAVKNEGTSISRRVPLSPNAEGHGKIPEPLCLWLARHAAELLGGGMALDSKDGAVVCTLLFPIVKPGAEMALSPQRTQFYYSEMVNPFGLLPLMMSDRVVSPIPGIV